MTFRELIRRLGDEVNVVDVRDALLYRCQHCLQLMNEHADDEKCLFGPTSFVGFPRRAVDTYAEYQRCNLHQYNFLRRKAT
jgi:cytidine deaminase